MMEFCSAVIANKFRCFHSLTARGFISCSQRIALSLATLHTKHPLSSSRRIHIAFISLPSQPTPSMVFEEQGETEDTNKFLIPHPGTEALLPDTFLILIIYILHRRHVLEILFSHDVGNTSQSQDH